MTKLAPVLVLVACGVEPVTTSEVAQNGMNMQGMNMQGMNMQGFQLGGVTLAGDTLSNVHVDKGQLVAQHGGVTVQGTDLVGAHLFAQVASNSDPSVTAQVEYRITAVTSEYASYDPTHTGSTYLYTLEQNVDGTTWSNACGVDADGNQVAIPVGAIFDAGGNRVESSTMFTFGCTTGVIAKCYRWGYRPWLTGYGTDMTDMHWACTRLARADYCGNGTSHTHDGTWVNVWDTLPAPGPIQKHGGLLPPLGMVFEAGWNTGGAVCLSRARWLLDDTLGNLCPDRLVAPGLLGATVCDTAAQVLGYDPNAKLLNESYLNL